MAEQLPCTGPAFSHEKWGCQHCKLLTLLKAKTVASDS
jgi:hypothetical protein